MGRARFKRRHRDNHQKKLITTVSQALTFMSVAFTIAFFSSSVNLIFCHI